MRGGEGRGGKRDQKNIYEGQIKAFVCCVGVGHVGVGGMWGWGTCQSRGADIWHRFSTKIPVLTQIA